MLSPGGYAEVAYLLYDLIMWLLQQFVSLLGFIIRAVAGLLRR